MKTTALLAFYILLITSVWSAEPDTSEAAKIFEQCSKGIFVPFSELTSVSGPMVPMDGDSQVHSAVLRYQSEIIAKEGSQAFDVAFRYLDDERVYMRWIAVDALGRITGKRPLWYFFGNPDQIFNGNPDWSDSAKKEWREWKKQNKAEMATPRKPSD